MNKIELRSGVVWLHKLSTGPVGDNTDMRKS